MRPLTKRLVPVGATLLMFAWLSAPTAHMQDTQAWQILGLLNTDRAEIGLPSLAMNNRLVAASQRHSDDMASGDFLSHTGSDGSEFWTRMTDAGYTMSTGAENVLYRWDASASGAFLQWRDSPPHYANIMNPAYQEVGIALAVAASGKHYYTMVLGARADFVPSTSAAPTRPLASATDVAVSATTMPLSPTSTVSPSASALAFPTDEVVAVTLTSLQSTSTALPIPDTPIPPPHFSDPPTVRVVEPALISPSAFPDSGEESVYAVLDTSGDPAQPRRSLREVVLHLLGQSAMEIIWPTPALPPGSAITPPVQLPTLTTVPLMPTVPAVADLRLEYTNESFTLINVAGGPVYIAGLWFESQSGALPIDRWDTDYLSAPLEYFPDRGCLQAWGLEADAVFSAPESCQIRHGWVTINSDQLFWRNVEIFTVHRYDETVTVCVVGLGSCDVRLSDRLMVYPTQQRPVVAEVASVSPPQGVPAGGIADVRLVYSPDSFAVLNSSGASLDLTGLGFSSSGGILNINQWDNEYLSRPLYAFPSGDCLQAWPLTASDWPAKPDQCNVRHAWIAVNDTYTFWIDTDYFTVSRNGVVLGTCSVGAGQCDVSLP